MALHQKVRSSLHALIRTLASTCVAAALFVTPLAGHAGRAFAETPAPSVTPAVTHLALGSTLPASEGLSLTLAKATPIITASSGYQASVTITNKSSQAAQAGTLTLRTSQYSLISSSNAQDWAEGRYNPYLFDLAQVSVPALKRNSSVTVTVTLKADDRNLASLRNWGPKPLEVVYQAAAQPNSGEADPRTGTTLSAHLNTFVTRSHDGLDEFKTPQMALTVVMPVVATGWQVRTQTSDTASVNQKSKKLAATLALVHDPMSTDFPLTLTKKAKAYTLAQLKLLKDYPHLQSVVDPALLASLREDNTPTSDKAPASRSVAISLYQAMSSISQPYSFDISRLTLDPEGFEKAGVSADTWSVQAGDSLASDFQSSSSSSSSQPSSTGENSGQSKKTEENSSSSTPASVAKGAIAWEGSSSWTARSLETAARAGYKTVIANSARPVADDSIVETGHVVMNTAAGDVTVLVTQSTLTQLAEGQKTSEQALAENSDAGRLQRFIAQSAIFQMQQPYVQRNLLVSLGSRTSLANSRALLSALQSADWLKSGTLADLRQGATNVSAHFDLAPDGNTAHTHAASTARQLSTLTKTLTTLSQLKKNVLVKASAKSSDNPGKEDKTDNPQPLARQNAKSSAEDDVTQDEWLAKLETSHMHLALASFASENVDTQNGSADLTALQADQKMNAELSNAVSIVKPSVINVFSESAQTPVTVTNRLPYPVKVKLAAQTDTQLTTVSSEKTLTVHENSEAQATLHVRVVGTSQTTLSIQVTDEQGNVLGEPQTTMLYTQLPLNDLSGDILIVLAVVLGIVGLRRQFTRKKGPDQ
ncbi:DUF6049 family protein [Aeriscardovia aeriphila]|uniref:Uncharacterized protein n=1 Tax=Aeriscardovia aeriphila TaxID=218139 RepID=A0A261F7K7_9BIFI|nr:DUF6049 family protein [Aeriscardovia aeriphila]NYI25100.1 hypothetical protein [Aeriscardovia aeriphila]OZG55112.1 hypothetical protein AEAE_1234 [Aeriscardovia aeriphila]